MADTSEIDKRFDIHEIAKNKNAELERFVCNIYCCHSTGCKSSGSDEIIELIKEYGDIAIANYAIKFIGS